MTLRSKMLTSVAALTIATGGAFAQSTDTETETDLGVSAEGGVTANTDAGQNPYAPGWNEDLDARYGDIADRQIAELIGMNVLTDGGEDVGEVDNFVLIEDELKAVIGVGGFLGLGEHEVALSLSDLTYDGDTLIIPFTKEELEAMPEYTEELEQIALNEQDTFRTRSEMSADADADAEMAGTQLETDVETNTVETAEADVEAEVETDEMAEADVQAEGETEEMAEADVQAEGETEEMAETDVEVEAETEETAEADVQAEGETEEMAEATEGEIEQEAEEIAAETENAVENATEETAEVAENVETDVEQTAEAAETELAEAGEATEEAVEDAAAETEQMAEGAAAATGEWFEKLDAEFAEIADWEINELEGKNVASADGNIIGEVDDLGMQNNKLVAVVGIGGFLGLGEHDVALDFANMTWDGEKFIVEGVTEEQLKGMAEYDPETLELLDDDTTLRAQANL